MCVTHASGRTTQAESAAKEKILGRLFCNKILYGNRGLPRSTRPGVACHPYFSRNRRLPVTGSSRYLTLKTTTAAAVSKERMDPFSRS
jgi:hypothetical protein